MGWSDHQQIMHVYSFVHVDYVIVLANVGGVVSRDVDFVKIKGFQSTWCLSLTKIQH